jgi:hypothetical protein
MNKYVEPSGGGKKIDLELECVSKRFVKISVAEVTGRGDFI